MSGSLVFRLTALLGVGTLVTACATAKKYRLAGPETPPALVLGWTAATPEAALTLQSLVVFKGPGSWKREARWDEYVVRLENRGSAPLLIRDAQLIDLQGQPQSPGTEPWPLEKLSYSNWEKYGRTGLQLLAGTGVAAVSIGAAAGAATGSLMAGPGAAGAAGGAAILPLAVIAEVVVVKVIDHDNKVKVEKEFNRRRLGLPKTLAPSEAVTGSFFFPMTPSPQALRVSGQSGEQPTSLALPLPELTGLHLAPPAKPTKS